MDGHGWNGMVGARVLSNPRPIVLSFPSPSVSVSPFFYRKNKERRKKAGRNLAGLGFLMLFSSARRGNERSNFRIPHLSFLLHAGVFGSCVHLLPPHLTPPYTHS